MARKRANGEGSIRRKKNNRWEAQIMIGYRADGSREIKSFSGATRKEAKEKMEDYMRKKESGLLIGDRLRFADWSATWFEYHKGNISLTSQESYSYTLHTLNAHFGDRKLAQIKPMDIELFLNKLQEEGKSNSYLAKCRGMLSQIFAKAQANDLIQKNPVALAGKMRKQPSERKEAFTAEEMRCLMENLPEDRMGWSIRLLLATGMRQQELLALEPKHITEDGALITVEQAVVRIKGGIAIGQPKTAGSKRIIPVPECVQYCARCLRETDQKFIWSVANSSMPCNPSHFARQFKRAVSSVEGVRILTPHSCRHTYISMLQMLEVDFEVIRDLSGHVNVDMTRHYLHVQAPLRLDAARRFSDAFSWEMSGDDSEEGH